jgi:endonuclease-8
VVVRSHLRMNGRWRIDRRGSERRGLPWLVLRGREWEATQWNGPVLTLEKRAVARLGPDLLADETQAAAVVAHLRHADQSLLVGEALVDQRLVAGIGNAWLVEALWYARVSPWRRLAEVSDDELTDAVAWAREHMRASVGGSRTKRSVYRHAGRPCPRCGTLVSSRGLGEMNRMAYWCAACQPSSGAA